MLEEEEKKVVQPTQNVCVVVLGDIGRSPRMQHHSLALAEWQRCLLVRHAHTGNADRLGGSPKVYVVGYDGSACLPRLSAHPHVELLPLLSIDFIESWRPFFPNVLFLLFAAIKLTYQVLSLFLILLFAVPSPVGLYLVQNPPALPTLPVVWLVSRLRRSCFMVDWHNYGWSLLGEVLRKGYPSLVRANKASELLPFSEEKGNRRRCPTKLRPSTASVERHAEASTQEQSKTPFGNSSGDTDFTAAIDASKSNAWQPRLRRLLNLEALARALELWFGRKADLSVCVSRAMKHDLESRWKVKVDSVLYDKPVGRFSVSSGSEKAGFLTCPRDDKAGAVRQTHVDCDEALAATGESRVAGSAELSLVAKHKLLFKYFGEEACSSAAHAQKAGKEIEDFCGAAVAEIDISALRQSVLATMADSPATSNALSSEGIDCALSSSSWSVSDGMSKFHSPTSVKPVWRERQEADLRPSLLSDGCVEDSLFTHAETSSHVREVPAAGTSVQTSGGTVHFSVRRQRRALLVTSTSWTVDEDMWLLLDALALYDDEVERLETAREISPSDRRLPDMLMLITGKGALKQTWLDGARRRALKHVLIRTVFADPQDYHELLSAADLGISLHTSSSGLDLPMKIVDMQGAGLPVLAFQFRTLAELVQEGKNGLLFTSAATLAERLEDLFCGFPESFDAQMAGSVTEEAQYGSPPSSDETRRSGRRNTGTALLCSLIRYARTHIPSPFLTEWNGVVIPLLERYQQGEL